MSYASARKTRLQQQLTRVQTALTAMWTTYTSATATGVDTYSIDSGEGAQRVTRRQLDSMFDQIKRLEATEAHLINELYNMGHISLKLRRKTPCQTFGQ